ncbi:MAG: GntR family transcriptional regulator [Zoogloeaceae bacterium]|jgi:GntR family transcriptional regulator|nr:GntR family transcriptional regulator [Zoogloeaceae bacterium]
MSTDSSSPVTHIVRPVASPTFSPLYRQIKELMVSALRAGEWAPGMAIPSESELAVRFGVSQGTVRKAIDEMAAEHLLVRRQGKGTFVESHNNPRAYYRFLRLQPNDRKVRQKRSIPLSCKLQPADRAVALALHLAPGESVVALERLLSFDDEVVVFDQMFLLADIFGELTLESLQQEEHSLYSIFERRFGVRMIRAEERLRAVAADRRIAELLKVGETEPLMLVERITYTYGDQPVEWRRGFYATDRYHYYNELN